VYRIRVLRGPSAAQWNKWGRKIIPFAVPAFLLDILLINWEIVPNFVDVYAPFALIATFAFFTVPLFMFAFQQRWELRNGYCTVQKEEIKLNAARASFAFVDDQTGIILARCDQLPITGEGLNDLRLVAHRTGLQSENLLDVSLPKYRWKITSTTFDWSDVTRPLYQDYLSRDSAPDAVETLQRIVPISNQ
jgi:hypothetical protein